MTENRDTSIVEARAALPLDGGVKCRQPERVEDGVERSVPKGETGKLEEKKMNKKVMLIPILALLLLSVPAAIAGDVHVEGDGTYSQTMKFGEVSYSFTLSGEWMFESDWGDGSHPYINNHITLSEGTTYYESIIYPVNSTGLDVLIVIEYGVQRIHDVANSQVRDYAFNATTFQNGGNRSVPRGETGYHRKNVR